MAFENALKAGTTLQDGRFVVGRVLGQGGFGITYEAEQALLGKRVALKECFLGDICDRANDGKSLFVLKSRRELFEKHKKRFLNEARRMAHLSNPHMVTVHDLFEENGTAYYVMDFIEGESLSGLLKRTGKPLDEAKVMDILTQMLDALECIHSQKPPLCHLDIKPANIMMDGDKVVLIDFGASKYVATADEERSSSSSFAYTPGYAPLEQLAGIREDMGPWTDFYALGATLYNLLSIEKPANPSVINDDHTPDKRNSLHLPSTISQRARKLILWLMAPSKNNRPQSVEEIRAFLKKGEVGDRETSKDSENQKSVENSENTAYSNHSDSSGHSDSSNDDVEIDVISLGDGERHKKTDGRHNGSNGGVGSSNNHGSQSRVDSQKPVKTGTKWLKPVGIAATIALALILEWRMISNAEATEKVVMSDEERNEILQNLVNNMVPVEGGMFMMGATAEQGDDAFDDESPAHQVTVSSFSIGKYEVTQEEWEAVRGENPSGFKGDKKRPVENVSWDDCQEFISKLNELTGKQFRLPTEAEWEFAARGGNKNLEQTKYAGGADIDAVAWYYDNSGSTTHPVGEKSPNALGLYDMSGNVREWCEDYYGPYDSSTQKDPKGPASGSDRVIRGWSWGNYARICRVSCRYRNNPSNRININGFRLAQ